jgi:hypothetical protein
LETRTVFRTIGLTLFAAGLGCAAPPGAAETVAANEPKGPTSWIAPPVNLHWTNDPRECGEHMADAAILAPLCAAAIKDNAIVLVWDWQGGEPPSGLDDVGKPDAYRVYVSFSGAAPIFVQDTTPHDARWTQSSFTDPLPNQPRCYTVTAFQGNTESAPSAPSCLDAPAPNSITVKLPLTQATSFARSASRNYDGAGSLPTGKMDGLRVGGVVAYLPDDLLFESWWYVWAWRAAFRFELPEDHKDHVLWNAVLHLHHQGNTLGDPATSCAKELRSSFVDWVRGLPDNTLPDGEWIADLPSTTGSDGRFDVDVTGIMRQWWSEGRANLGFLMNAAVEGYQESDFECESQYSTWLEVTYF